MILIFTQKCLLLRLATCKIGELQYTHVKNVPGIQIMETVSIAKCKQLLKGNMKETRKQGGNLR